MRSPKLGSRMECSQCLLRQRSRIWEGGISAGGVCIVAGGHLYTCLSHSGKVSPVCPITNLQSCIDWNREVLKRELGLSDCDIIDIPQLFKTERRKAVAFFPDLVSSPAGHPQMSSETQF